MKKATIEIDISTHSGVDSLVEMLSAANTRRAMEDFQNSLRSICKYEEHPEPAEDMAQRIYEMWFEVLNYSEVKEKAPARFLRLLPPVVSAAAAFLAGWLL